MHRRARRLLVALRTKIEREGPERIAGRILGAKRGIGAAVTALERSREGNREGHGDTHADHSITPASGLDAFA